MKVGSILGTITIKEPITHHETYSYAAWYRDHKSDTGQFIIALGSDVYNYSSKHTVYATLTSTITANDLSPHFGGVAYGKGRSEVGNQDSFTFSMSLYKAIMDPRILFSSNEILDAILDLLQHDLTDAIEFELKCMAKCFAEAKEKKDGWSIGMVAHYAKSVAVFGEALQRVQDTRHPTSCYRLSKIG